MLQFSSLSSGSKSDFFDLFDTDSDGLISFPEYIFFITLLSLSENEVKSTFQKFDRDGSGKLCRIEFNAMMRAMRRSTSRGNGSGQRTGLKSTNPDVIGNGLVHYLFGDPAKEHKLSFEQFESFLRRIKMKLTLLSFNTTTTQTVDPLASKILVTASWPVQTFAGCNILLIVQVD